MKTELSPGEMIRTSDAGALARELQVVRTLTLGLMDAYEAAGLMDVPCEPQFNLPLWEAGHVAWFAQWWIARNQQRDLGHQAEPDHQRLPCAFISAPHHGDAWYNSSTVAHAARWQLPLLNAKDCRSYLKASLDQTLSLLSQAGSSDNDLYFYRLILLHEAMHAEAAMYMAQALHQPIALPEGVLSTIKTGAFSADSMPANGSFRFKKQVYRLGQASSQGFSFDNELGISDVPLGDFEIDARPVNWARYLTFVSETGYALPACLRMHAGGYEQIGFGRWQPLNMQASAVHISWHDAQAYCLWAGRRLPSEAEWECAISQQPAMAWGEVWEWTASDFLPFEGFQAHPYRDYSAPWFGSRKVLRGACAATLPIMRNPRYRNYFTPERTDIYSGFRTCAL